MGENKDRYEAQPLIPSQPGAFLRGKAVRPRMHAMPFKPRLEPSIEFKEMRNVQYKTLREIAGGNPMNWQGRITLEGRSDVTLAEVENLLPNLPYVKTEKGLAIRCGDGRSNAEDIAKIAAGKRDRTIGPQIFGGSPGCALAGRAVQISNEGAKDGITFTGDVSKTIEFLGKRGVEFGAHIDDHAHGDNCGCGAIDKIPDMLAMIARDTSEDRTGIKVHGAAEQMLNITKAVLGRKYDEEIALELCAAFKTIHEQNGTYLERQPDGSYTYKKQVVAEVERQSKNPRHAKQRMEGKHNEVALVINTEPGTTLNRAKLNHDTDKRLQVFNVDYWFCEELADTYYPHNAEDRSKWLHARIIEAAATAMVLTDGSLPVYVRT